MPCTSFIRKSVTRPEIRLGTLQSSSHCRVRPELPEGKWTLRAFPLPLHPAPPFPSAAFRPHGVGAAGVGVQDRGGGGGRDCGVPSSVERLGLGEPGSGGLMTRSQGPVWACWYCTLPAPQMVAKFFPPKHKLLSECICLVLVILGMWGSQAPTPIMLTHPPARGTSSSISAPPIAPSLHLPPGVNRSTPTRTFHGSPVPSGLALSTDLQGPACPTPYPLPCTPD